MGHYSYIAKSENPKIFENFIIKNKILTQEEFDKDKEKLKMPSPFPELYMTSCFGDFKKIRALYCEKHYEQFMLEIFQAINIYMYVPDEPESENIYLDRNEILHIVCKNTKNSNNLTDLIVRLVIDKNNEIFFSSIKDVETGKENEIHLNGGDLTLFVGEYNQKNYENIKIVEDAIHKYDTIIVYVEI